MVDIPSHHGLYSISVTSELTGVGAQMLRTYETRGLLTPYRTEGGTRRYSSRDLERIERITELLGAGLNLAGIEQVLRLQAETEELRAEIDRLRSELPQGGDVRRRGRSGRRVD